MDYFRKATPTSPAVIMDSRLKSILISGKSICRSKNSYSEVVDKILQNLESSSYTDLNIKLNAFNVPAAKSLLALLRGIKRSTHKPSINWVCNAKDQEMMEMGKNFSELLDMKINISAN
ncbi:MAG: SiaC family regulatory phosphoprotein [Bacteroidota bacterium]